MIATCVLGVLGAGAAGVAAAGDRAAGRGHAAARPAAQQLGPATRVSDAPRARRPHWPRPTTTRPTRPTTPPPVTTPPAETTPPVETTPPAGTTPPPVETTPPPVETTPPTGTSTPPPVETTAPPATNGVIERALAHINAARADAGLVPYTLNPELTNAAAAHNALMVAGCGLSHQCPGEAGLGQRFTAAGVNWRSAGENIGQGNAANNDASIVAAANGLTDLMLAETPPNDGHRRNLLNPGFTRIGLAVTRGADGRVWYTQDFAN